MSLSVDLLALLNDRYDPESMAALYQTWLRPIHQKEAAWLDEEAAHWAKLLRRHHRLPCDEVVVLALIYAYKDLFHRLMKALPEAIAQTFYRLVWHGPHTLEELEARLGQRLASLGSIPASELAQRAPIDWRFFWIDAIRQGECATLKLWLPNAVRDLLRPHLGEPPGHGLPGTRRPPVADFRFLESEPIHFLSNCLIYAASGAIRFAKGTRRLLKKTVRQFKGAVGGQTFYPGVPGMEDVRAVLTLRFLANVDVKDLGDADRKALLRGLLNAYWRGSDALGLDLLGHLSGRGVRAQRMETGCGAETAVSMRALVNAMPEHAWVSLDSILAFSQTRGLRYLAVPLERSWPDIYADLESSIEGDQQAQRIFVRQSNHAELVAMPLLKTHLFLLASLGVVEAAYDLPKSARFRLPGADFLTPYDGLGAVRLTDWGKALLDRGPAAAFSGMDPKPKMAVLEENALIIAVETKDGDLPAFLAQIARPISPRRFKVDFDSFLKGLDSDAAVQARIQLFLQRLGGKLPAHWQAFFAEARRRIGEIEPEPEWLVFRTRRDPVLLAFLQAEPALRGRVVRAEGGKILIRKQDLGHIKQILLRRGFLIQTS